MMPRMTVFTGPLCRTDLHRVVALVTAPQSTFELACAAEVFGLDRPGLPTRYTFDVCALRPGPVTTRAGYSMNVEHGLNALENADTIVVAGWPNSARPARPALARALIRAHDRGARLVGLCSGTFLLAEIGLLDGRAATTHWRMAAELSHAYPRIEVRSDELYVDLEDVATSAGTAAGIDLCLHLARQDHGAAYAANIARHMVMPPRREGDQKQFSAVVAASAPSSLAPVMDWARSRLHEPLGLPELARHAGLSTRTIARRFAEQAGVSPGQWILNERIEAACVLLEQTELGVEAISRRVGLSTAANMRRRFRGSKNTTPGSYRRMFSEQRAPMQSADRSSRMIS